MKTFYVRADQYAEVVKNLRAGRKIQAIKALRNSTGCKLREAKLAVETVAHRVVVDLNTIGYPQNNEYDVEAQAMVTKVTMVVGEGEVEVDLDTAQFYVMKDLGKVPLKETRRLATLLTQLEEFSRGEPIDES